MSDLGLPRGPAALPPSAAWSLPVRDWRLHTPDEVLLRRFGHVRAVGGAIYLLIVAILFAVYDTAVWPMLIGAPILAVVTTAYFRESARYPRASVAVSLIADLVVLAAGVMVLGGTGSGLVLLYSIVIVSAGILLGASSATSFTGAAIALALLQLLLEQLGVEPALQFNPDLGDRVAVLGVAIAGLGSVGYLTATYGSRLHELLANTSADLAAIRQGGRRRREYVRLAAREVTEPLAQLERLADDLEAAEGPPAHQVAAGMRVAVTRVQAGVEMLADVGAMDAIRDTRPEPLLLGHVVDDCLTALADRIGSRPVEADVPPLRVVGNRRGTRRIIYNLVENVLEHTPEGTPFEITAVRTAGQVVLVVSDHGPGIPDPRASRLFEPASGPRQAVGLPLVRELAEAMGARVRYERARDGGARFMVAFRLAPSAARGAPPGPAPRRDPAPPAAP